MDTALLCLMTLDTGHGGDGHGKYRTEPKSEIKALRRKQPRTVPRTQPEPPYLNRIGSLDKEWIATARRGVPSWVPSSAIWNIQHNNFQFHPHGICNISTHQIEIARCPSKVASRKTLNDKKVFQQCVVTIFNPSDLNFPAIQRLKLFLKWLLAHLRTPILIRKRRTERSSKNFLRWLKSLLYSHRYPLQIRTWRRRTNKCAKYCLRWACQVIFLVLSSLFLVHWFAF